MSHSKDFVARELEGTTSEVAVPDELVLRVLTPPEIEGVHGGWYVRTGGTFYQTGGNFSQTGGSFTQVTGGYQQQGGNVIQTRT